MTDELAVNATLNGATMEERLTWDTAHGNEIVGRGDCPVCGRKDVPLTHQERNDRDVCANDFACFAAWKEAKGGMRTVIVNG